MLASYLNLKVHYKKISHDKLKKLKSTYLRSGEEWQPFSIYNWPKTSYKGCSLLTDLSMHSKMSHQMNVIDPLKKEGKLLGIKNFLILLFPKDSLVFICDWGCSTTWYQLVRLQLAQAVLVNGEGQLKVRNIPIMVLDERKAAIQLCIERWQLVNWTVEGLVLCAEQLTEEERCKRNIHYNALKHEEHL